MRMTFGVENEGAYFARRDELCEQFAEWAEHRHVDGEPGDVELLLDWKWGYGDGRLDRWSPADVEEFLLEWCPRKVASPPDLVSSIPDSVAAFVDFLAQEGLLAPGSSPSAIRAACTELGPRFRREMADPANFGMAKSLLSGLGTDDPQALLDQLAQLTGTSSDELLDLLDDTGPTAVGPVRMPSEDEVTASIGAARMFVQVRGLAAHCGPPGLTLTAKGNLGLADARRLTTELATGENPDAQFGSSTDLPYLNWLVNTALAAGAVRRQRGRLVAVARFAARTDRDGYERTVRGALEAGLGSPMSWAWRDVPANDDGLAVILLAELLDAGDTGSSVAAIAERISPLLGASGPLAGQLGAGEVGHQLKRLADLGLVTLTGDEAATITAAGRVVGAEIVVESGIEVVYRADPATADAESLLDSVLLLDEDDATADLRAWASAHPFGTAELTAAMTHADVPSSTVLALLELAGTAVGTDIDRAAEAHRDGPHGALVTMWLVLRGAVDPASVDPELMLTGTVEVAAVMIDDAGPEGVVEFFDSDPDQTVGVLEHLWRADHERTEEVLDALGRHHPDKKVAKAARRSLMKARSRG